MDGLLVGKEKNCGLKFGYFQRKAVRVLYEVVPDQFLMIQWYSSNTLR
jgi:hypothetical protein